MTQSKVIEKSRQAHELNDVTESILKDIRTKDIKFRTSLILTLIVLLGLGVFGIYKQNEIANQNKAHIDCIVKLFTSPTRATEVITNSTSTCDIVPVQK